jgi:Flp pilus assembly protein CpaB
VSRRGRAVAYASAAAVCAGLAAGATQGDSPGVAAQGGELREVVVAARPLEARAPLRAKSLADAVEVRRVPASFLPPDALSTPEQAAGRRPAVTIPAGSYVVASDFTAPGPKPERQPVAAADPGRRAVEITVSGAGALASASAQARSVDVVVTSEPGPGGGTGRTYVAAPAVELLDLRAADEAAGTDVAPGPATDAWIATLALTRPQALRLIQAESFARSIRLIER